MTSHEKPHEKHRNAWKVLLSYGSEILLHSRAQGLHIALETEGGFVVKTFGATEEPEATAFRARKSNEIQ